MSNIQCRQLHNELFECRHITLQSHGPFALAKHLLLMYYQFIQMKDIWGPYGHQPHHPPTKLQLHDNLPLCAFCSFRQSHREKQHSHVPTHPHLISLFI